MKNEYLQTTPSSFFVKKKNRRMAGL
jgi:hypothetical protein